MYRPVLVEAPVIMPVTLEEAKAHARIDHDDDDDLIIALIESATDDLDSWTGSLARALCEQTWLQQYDCFERCLRLPLFPVISIAAVKYIDPAGTEQTVAEANYTLRTDSLGAYVEFRSTYAWPSVTTDRGAVSVTYVAGYADTPAVAADPDAIPPVAAQDRASTVPRPIRQAMLLTIGHWYNNREAVLIGEAAIEMPIAVQALLSKFRRSRF